jgi:iron-sulfur cluster assembly accessory protein
MAANRISLANGSVTISEGAEAFMRRMVRFGGIANGGFRLVVSPGGCSGLSADFSIEAQPQEGDHTLSLNGLRVFVPPQSAKLLEGATIDFADSRVQQGLTFLVPNGPAACGDTAKPALVQLTGLTPR